MPRYRFLLHDGPQTPVHEEFVEASDDAQAFQLAKLRILLSHAFTHVQIFDGDREMAGIDVERRDASGNPVVH